MKGEHQLDELLEEIANDRRAKIRKRITMGYLLSLGGWEYWSLHWNPSIWLRYVLLLLIAIAYCILRVVFKPKQQAKSKSRDKVNDRKQE